MTTPYDDLANEALALPPRDKVRLAQALTASLEAEVDSQADVETLWREEIRRLMDEIRSGTVACIPAAEVLEEARARIY